MMRFAKQRYAVLAAAMAMLAGCAKEDILIKNTPKGATYVTATMPASAKTTYTSEPGNTTNPSLNVQWESDDFFYGFMIDGSGITGVKFTNADETSSSSATFRADVYDGSEFKDGSLQSGSKIFAIYPSSELQSECNHFSYKEATTYKSYSGIFLDNQPGTLIGLKDFDIMTAVADVKEDENNDVICDLHFTHKTAILHIQNIGVKEASGTAESIKLEADGLANYACFMPNDSGWKLDDTYNGEINIKPVAVKDGKLPDLYISVMPGTLSDIKLSFRVGNKGYELKLTTHDGSSSKEIVAGKMYTVEGKELKHYAELYTEPVLADKTKTNSETNPYLITAKEELEYVRYHLDGHYRLVNDIALSTEVDWKPIGDRDNPFTGTFDGNKNTVLNIKIYNEEDFQGFFGYVDEDAIVKNLTVAGEISANDYVGGIAGLNHGTIAGCTNNVSLTAKGEDAYCGGIAGQNSGTITNCINTAEIAGKGTGSSIGGIVGYNSDNNSDGEIVGCKNIASVSSAAKLSRIGGIVGDSRGGSITFCTNEGEISGDEYARVGGIIGFGYAYCQIEACTNSAKITGGASANVGGIVGDAGTGAKCLGCANKGDLASGSGAKAGGIMSYAYSSIITACYNTGEHGGTGTFNQISNGETGKNCYFGDNVIANIMNMNEAWENDSNSSGKYVFNGTGEIVVID